MLWLLIVLDVALFVLLTIKRRVPLFRVWLVLIVLWAATYHPWAGAPFWLAWARTEWLIIVARAAIMIEAFLLATNGLPGSFRALLALASTIGASAGIVAVWSVVRDGFAVLVRIRMYELLGLTIFGGMMIGVFWMAGKRPKVYARRHGLMVTWLLACDAIPACLDQYIMTGAQWTAVSHAIMLGLCAGLAWGIWFNRRDPPRSAQAA